jgi:hypothetical protein
MSEAEQAAYLQKLIDGVPSYQQLGQDVDKEKVRTAALRKYTRFLRLSYYVTGK